MKRNYSMIAIMVLTVCLIFPILITGCTNKEQIENRTSVEAEPYEEAEPIEDTIPAECENTGTYDWVNGGLNYCVEYIVKYLAPNFADSTYTWESNWEESRFREGETIKYCDIAPNDMFSSSRREFPYLIIKFDNGAELQGKISWIRGVDRTEPIYDEFTGTLTNPIEYGDLCISIFPEWTRVSPDGTTESYLDNRNDELYLVAKFNFNCDIEGDQHVWTNEDYSQVVCGCANE